MCKSFIEFTRWRYLQLNSTKNQKLTRKVFVKNFALRIVHCYINSFFQHYMYLSGLQFCFKNQARRFCSSKLEILREPKIIICYVTKIRYAKLYSKKLKDFENFFYNESNKKSSCFSRCPKLLKTKLIES